MTLDATMRPLAKELLEEFGKASTLTRTVQGAYDPVTGQSSGDTVTPYTVYCSPPERFAQNLVDGTNVLQTDVQTLIAAKDLAISPSPTTDTVTFDNVVYTLVDAAPIYSGNEIAAFQLHLRV